MRRIVQSPAGTSHSSEPFFFIFDVRSMTESFATRASFATGFTSRFTLPREANIFSARWEICAVPFGVG